MTSMYDDRALKGIADLLAFLHNPVVVNITLMGTPEERADWIFERLQRFRYATLSKKEKGIVLCYVIRVTGLSEKQLDRHVRAYRQGRTLCKEYSRTSFPTRYTHRDSELIAEIDNATGRLSGGLTIALMRDQYISGDTRFERLRDISVAQLYRLRSTLRYRETSLVIGKTKSVDVPIGTRTKPDPGGIPGSIRVDTVHQGDFDGEKGVYHVNLADEVTQWEVVFAVEEISERFLLPLLEGAIRIFPFIIRNFHSDNGSEYINYRVAKMLEKLRISQTKSRPRHSTDNGLIECKNGAIIRKEFGHWHIPGVFAPRINRFYHDHLIPYLNFYRPCHFPVKIQDEKGKIMVKYPAKNCMTPYQKLISIPDWEKYLHPNITKTSLEKILKEKTPLQAAQEKKKARDKLMRIVLPKLSDTISSTITNR